VSLFLLSVDKEKETHRSFSSFHRQIQNSEALTSYLPRLFKKDMLTDPEVFLKIISQNQDN